MLVNNAAVLGCIVDARGLRAAGLGNRCRTPHGRKGGRCIEGVSKREGSHETKGWPASHSAYIVSKEALNAYTRILAAKCPRFRINCVCPGFVKKDILHNTGFLNPEEGAKGPMTLSLLPDDGLTGGFFQGTKEWSSVLYENGSELPNGEKFTIPDFN
ncbi:hypothetical protein ACJRO7_018735 [Eucalyptus globulus]|uniref:Uncharacterized protein n=1 Tax=Eucalyptus globulus TaxID=34317 RepID=A0ABD3KUS0_EUCGL